MTPDVTDVRPLGSYVLEVSFADGARRRIDLADELYGPLFDRLRDLAYFQQARVDPEVGAVVWPNGADFSPEFLYSTTSTVVDELAEPRTI